jgi:hypothetical protein
MDRIKKFPSLTKKYSDLEKIDIDDNTKIEPLIKDFSSYNRQVFQKNIEWFTSTNNMKSLGFEKATHYVDNNQFVVSLNMLTNEKTNYTLKNMLALLQSLGGPDQAQVVADCLSNMPQRRLTPPKIGVKQELTFTIPIPYPLVNFYDNLLLLESDFVANWNAVKMLASIMTYVVPVLKDEERAEIFAERGYLNFKTSEFKDNVFKADGFSVVETPAAKAAREIKEKLELALKRRTKMIDKIGITEGAIEYTFEESELEPFRVALDVVTHW